MELRNLASFVRVAELQSFSAAARSLGYSQSTVTLQIQQLEGELGVSLFDRINKTVRPTPSGLKLLEYARTMLKAADDARRAIQAAPQVSGTLRIALADSLCTAFFPRLLELYHRRFPQVELRLIPAGSTEMERLLSQNDADMIYTMDHRITRSDLVTALETEAAAVIVAAPSHPLAGREVTPEELARQDFILTERGMSYRDEFDRRMALRRLEVRPFLELGNVEMIQALVERGMGVSLLPEYTVNAAIAAGTLVRLSVPGCDIRLWRQLIYHRDKYLTAPMEAMIGLMREEIRS